MRDSTLLSREDRHFPLLQMVKREILIPGKADGADYGIALFDRLQQLKSQKEELEDKLGLVSGIGMWKTQFKYVDAEIETVAR